MLQIKKSFLALTMLMVSGLNAMIIDQKSLSMPSELNTITIMHEDNIFKIDDDTGTHIIAPHQMNKELRNIPTDKLAKMLTAGSYIKVNKALNNENYSLELNQRMQGGGVWGAWVGSWIGYGAVTLAGHTAIHLAALCTGPMYVPVAASLTKIFTAPIHVAATGGGIAVGITGAVITGPV